MAAIRFIHSSDLHLGRSFANIPQPPDGNVRGRLMEARHTVLDRLAGVARRHGAAHVLLAGDSFDSATPSAEVMRHALTAMAQASDITWWLLPGNHDNLRDAEPLWDAIRTSAPPNLRPLTDGAPVAMAPGAMLLPCPVVWRSSGRDPTETLADMPTPDGALRVGLAHGGVVDFLDTGASIPPDRDRTARLDYLALGDWHGPIQVTPRTHYPGSPEQDRFRHGQRGACLAVTLDGPGAVPRVEVVETGLFWWTEAVLPLRPGQDAAAALSSLLPPDGRRDVLMRVRATGRTTLPEQQALSRAAARHGPDFAHFQLLAEGLGIDVDTAHLDAIDGAGALRLAAQSLKDEAEDPARDQSTRDIAAAALGRLYGYMAEDAS